MAACFWITKRSRVPAATFSVPLGSRVLVEVAFGAVGGELSGRHRSPSIPKSHWQKRRSRPKIWQPFGRKTVYRTWDHLERLGAWHARLSVAPICSSGQPAVRFPTGKQGLTAKASLVSPSPSRTPACAGLLGLDPDLKLGELYMDGRIDHRAGDMVGPARSPGGQHRPIIGGASGTHRALRLAAAGSARFCAMESRLGPLAPMSPTTTIFPAASMTCSWTSAGNIPAPISPMTTTRWKSAQAEKKAPHRRQAQFRPTGPRGAGYRLRLGRPGDGSGARARRQCAGHHAFHRTTRRGAGTGAAERLGRARQIRT